VRDLGATKSALELCKSGQAVIVTQRSTEVEEFGTDRKSLGTVQKWLSSDREAEEYRG
jgi:hypothetical protein